MVRRVILDDVNGGNYVSLTLEVIREPGTDEVLGPGPAAPTSLAGIVRDQQELDIHGEIRTMEGV